ncbi:MAG TPA: class I SAM-dependent methyltransferase [Gaiellales bacterium]|nr:class I SAM-dependent methyltransferase [Gaiellales bacterium]
MREYDSEAKTSDYLTTASQVPHRDVGEALLLERLPEGIPRVLDLGCGDGHLLALVLSARPGSHGLAVDVSRPMLERARARFAADGRAAVVEHDLAVPLPPSWGVFDAVVSSFAIHHLGHARKRELYAEVFAALEPGGVFCNLEHVASPTPAMHARFVQALGGVEDETNILLDVETQLRWLREVGFVEVDCDWKWRELALLAGRRP